MNFRHSYTPVVAALLVAAAASCNKDGLIIDEPDAPEIIKPELPDADDNAKVLFAPLSYAYNASIRYTYVGRPVVLQPVLNNVHATGYSWSVDGKDVGCKDDIFSYKPTTAGSVIVRVAVTTQQGNYEAQMQVVAVERNEMAGFRSKGNNDRVTDIFEYTPAPGQFICETFTPQNAGEACNWVKGQFDKSYDVSLGSFGGTLIAGFDHSVAAGGRACDFVIVSNAFISPTGSSNEPGIVWVMQDVNGNGKPDDMWYQIRGSEYDNPATLQNLAVTYTRGADGQPVPWVTSTGQTGVVPYMAPMHKQPNYYPAWIEPAKYTLYGTCLPFNGHRNESGTNWALDSYAFGYADNIGSDVIETDKPGTHTGFRISDAVHADGTPANLQYIDFVKVQTGVLGACGPLGEASTEVSGIYQYK